MRIEDIAPLLPYVSVLEVLSTEVATFRLAGTALCEAMGIEMTGLNYFDFTTLEERGLRSARVNRLVGQPAGSYFVLPIPFRSGRLVPTEFLSLPVRPNDPAAPMQLFALTKPMEDLHLEGPVAASNQIPVAESFQFIDIGAGVPDSGLDLANRPPASLLLEKMG